MNKIELKSKWKNIKTKAVHEVWQNNPTEIITISGGSGWLGSQEVFEREFKPLRGK